MKRKTIFEVVTRFWPKNVIKAQFCVTFCAAFQDARKSGLIRSWFNSSSVGRHVLGRCVQFSFVSKINSFRVSDRDFVFSIKKARCRNCSHFVINAGFRRGHKWTCPSPKIKSAPNYRNKSFTHQNDSQYHPTRTMKTN